VKDQMRLGTEIEPERGAASASPRAEVLWFAQEMEGKLRANDHKGHWDGCRFDYLSRRLAEESEELNKAILASSGQITLTRAEADRIIHEAADVANFAMMIADNAKRLRGGGDTER
jgi:hypothetical protein